MVFITSVTSVTKIKRYPSRLTLWAQKKTHVYPYHYRPRPSAKSGDRGDSGDDPDAGAWRTSLKGCGTLECAYSYLTQLLAIKLLNIINTIITTMCYTLGQ
jgi:hypothetical protein